MNPLLENTEQKRIIPRVFSSRSIAVAGLETRNIANVNITPTAAAIPINAHSEDLEKSTLIVLLTIMNGIPTYIKILESAPDFEKALHQLIKKTISKHKRIIFNGNGYEDAWIKEAEKRGLSNLKTTPDALARYLDEKNVALFTSHKVYGDKEMQSRLEIFLEHYCQIIEIEGRTMLDMATKDILPAVSEYSQVLCNTLLAKKAVCDTLPRSYETDTLKRIAELTESAYEDTKRLQDVLSSTQKEKNVCAKANAYKDIVLPVMQALRKSADELETLVSADHWPFPNYGELLFGIIE